MIVTKADAQAWLDEQGAPSPETPERGGTGSGEELTPKYLRLAAEDDIRDYTARSPSGILIGFAPSDQDWFDYRLEHHPEFLSRIEEARAALRAGKGIPLREYSITAVSL